MLFARPIIDRPAVVAADDDDDDDETMREVVDDIGMVAACVPVRTRLSLAHHLC